MTAALVSSQGFTYKMTCVTLSNCLTSGVHLNRPVTVRSNWVSSLFATKALPPGGAM